MHAPLQKPSNGSDDSLLVPSTFIPLPPCRIHTRRANLPFRLATIAVRALPGTPQALQASEEPQLLQHAREHEQVLPRSDLSRPPAARVSPIALLSEAAEHRWWRRLDHTAGAESRTYQSGRFDVHAERVRGRAGGVGGARRDERRVVVVVIAAVVIVPLAGGGFVVVIVIVFIIIVIGVLG